MKKLFTSLAFSSLISIFTIGNVMAQNQNQPKQTKPQTKQAQTKQNQAKNQKQQAQKKQQNQKANAPQTLSSDEALKQFNASFGIRLVARQINQNQGQLLLRYELTNKSAKDIHEVQFISAFTHNNQIIYAQEIPLTFNTPLQAQNMISLDISVPLEKVPAQARTLLADSNTPIGLVNGAQLLTFTDKTKLEIK